MKLVLPRYPVYVPSKGRAKTPLTVRFLTRDEVPFYLVVEPSEVDEYAPLVPGDRLLVLPRDGMRLIGARNWIKDHSIAAGAERHWQLDDNIGQIRRLYRGKRIPCAAGPALAVVEDFVDRYENVAIAGLNYQMFGTPGAPPFAVNVHVYSCTLVNNAIPHRWRLLYNDDTDLCLQVLADGWCTVLVNAFLADKKTTMTVKGGNTDDLYQGDGRLRMARALERAWPGVVRVDRRYGRPQHVIDWTRFRTPLRLKPDVDLRKLRRRRNEYGLRLVAKKEPQAPGIRALVEKDAPQT